MHHQPRQAVGILQKHRICMRQNNRCYSRRCNKTWNIFKQVFPGVNQVVYDTPSKKAQQTQTYGLQPLEGIPKKLAKYDIVYPQMHSRTCMHIISCHVFTYQRIVCFLRCCSSKLWLFYPASTKTTVVCELCQWCHTLSQYDRIV